MSANSAPVIATRVAENMRSASWIRAMFEKGRALRAKVGEESVFDFSLGNPDGIPPKVFFESVEAVAAERNAAAHRYMPNAGLDATRGAIATFLTTEYRAPIEAAGVVVTCGAAGAMNVTLRAICNPGDEVIVLAPYFPEYRFYIEQAGANLVTVDTDSAFLPDFAALARAWTPRTRAVIVNSPNNPTGVVYDEATCRRLAEFMRAHDAPSHPAYLLCDDPYKRLVFDLDWCPTPVPHYPRALVLSSYSKDLSIPGERIGYIGVPSAVPGHADLLGALTMLNRTLGYVNAPAFMQRVVARCADALCDVSVYRQKRDALCAMLADAGYQFTRPGGGMFVFPRTPIEDDAAFVDVLLQKNILAVPGRGFGRPGHMRLSLAVPPQTITRSAAGFAAALGEVR